MIYVYFIKILGILSLGYVIYYMIYKTWVDNLADPALREAYKTTDDDEIRFYGVIVLSVISLFLLILISTI